MYAFLSTRNQRLRLFAIQMLIVAAAGCSGPSDQRSSTPVPAATSTEKPRSGAPVKVDLVKIFPPGAGRELVLGNCQSCHALTPIIILQMDRDAWHRSSLAHRERVPLLSDEEFKSVYEYLPQNFGPHRPVPELPQALLDEWTSY